MKLKFGVNRVISNKLRGGFGLIELLLIITTMAILLVVVFAALNPTKRLEDTRNAKRWIDVNEILTAVHECVADNGMESCGVANDGRSREIVDGTVNTKCNVICMNVVEEGDCANLSRLTTGVGTNNTIYLPSLPTDPLTTVTNHTSYSITATNSIMTIEACGAEGQPISVSR